MSLREFVALGTSSQAPTRHRNHNGYLVRWDGQGFLFDPGEGTQRQFILADVSVTEVNRIFVTHFHGDHALGLPGIVQRLSLDQVSRPVEIFYPKSGQVYLDRLLNCTIHQRTVEIIQRPVSGNGGVVTDDGKFRIEAYPLSHGKVDTYGYRIQEPDSSRFDKQKLKAYGVAGKAVGQLQRNGEVTTANGVVKLGDVSVFRRGSSFAHVMDTIRCPGALSCVRDTDLAIIESTYLDRDRGLAKAHHHLTARQSAEIARDGGARGILVLSHFSQRYPSIKPFTAEARKVYPKAVAVKDLDRITIPR